MSDTPKRDPLFQEFPVPPLSEWKDAVQEDLKGADFEKKLVWKTMEGVDIQPLYTSSDLEGLDHLETLPGVAPFVRSSSLSQDWKVDCEIDAADPAEANRLAKAHLATGQKAVGFDLPLALRRGCSLPATSDRSTFDSGVRVESPEDLWVLLDGIDLRSVFLSFQAGYSAPALLEALPDWTSGALNYDPLRYLATCGTVRGEWSTVFDVMASLVTECRDHRPGLIPVTVSAFPWHQSGATLVQETACALSTGVLYLSELTQRGISIDDAARALRFEFSVGTNFSFELTRLRAARTLWATIVRAFGATREDAMAMTLHLRTSLWSITAHDPYVNMLRGTVETLAAALGGAATICTEPFDAALGDSSDFSLRIARNTQIILKEESQLASVIDPAAGSYFYEHLTDRLSKEIWTLFQELETRGGILPALMEGWIQERIDAVREKKLAALAQRREVFIGINQYPNLTEGRADWKWMTVSSSGSGLDPDPDTRYGGPERTDLCRPLHPMRGPESFERLRDAVESRERKPRVFLATLGPVFWRRARATFASGFLGAAGFAIQDNVGFADPAEAAAAALDHQADIVVVCSDDESYPTLVPDLTARIKQVRPETLVIVAGYPKDSIDALTAAGVDEFIHVKSNALTVLTGLVSRLGIPVK